MANTSLRCDATPCGWQLGVASNASPETTPCQIRAPREQNPRRARVNGATSAGDEGDALSCAPLLHQPRVVGFAQHAEHHADGETAGGTRLFRRSPALVLLVDVYVVTLACPMRGITSSVHHRPVHLCPRVETREPPMTHTDSASAATPLVSARTRAGVSLRWSRE